jgi:Type IV secretion system pilin
MQNLRTIGIYFFTALLSLVVLFAFLGSPVRAADSSTDPSGYTCTGRGLNIPTCTGNGQYTGATSGNPIVLWIIFFINVISSLIGFGAVLMIVVAGIQYSAAGDNAQSIQSAKKKITNVLIGLAAYIAFYSILNWLVPGGVL